MTRFTIILLLLTSLTETFGQSNFECKCKSYFQKVFQMTDKEDNALLVCGLIKDTVTDNSIKINSISVYDCSNQELVLTYNHDEIVPFTVTNYNDSIVFYNHHFVPIGDDWKMTSAPFEEWTVKFVNDTADVSTGRIIFNYPELSTNQVDSIKTICKILNSYKGKVLYPLGYETLYILFVGALKDIAKSRWTYENLRKNFEFDGAAAETLGEIHYNTLIRKKKN